MRKTRLKFYVLKRTDPNSIRHYNELDWVELYLYYSTNRIASLYDPKVYLKPNKNVSSLT